MVPVVSEDGDAGKPTLLRHSAATGEQPDLAVEEVKTVMRAVADRVWAQLAAKSWTDAQFP